MSETKDPRRTRRKASRTAGPPPVENTPGDATDLLDTGSELPGSAEKPAAGDKATEQTATEPASGGAAGSAENNRPDDTTDDPVRLRKPAGDEAGPAVEPVPLGKSTERSSDTDGDTTTSAEESGGAESETPDTAAGSGRSWKRIVALAAVAVLVIGLVGAAVVSMVAVQSTQQRDERRSEYVATARQTVLNLTTIRADTAKEDIDRILTTASGEFKTEFDGRIDPFTEIVKQANVVSTGEVVEAAVERDDEQSAVVLVAAKQTLTNAGKEGEQQRYYRFRVTVARADDGAMTASDVEFVA